MNLRANDDRIVFTLAFGHRKFAEMALGLGRSLRLIGDTTRRVVLTDLDDYPWEKSFDQVIRLKVPTEDLGWAKLYALEHTDAKRVLFIDGDGLAFKRLDPIFDAFAGQLIERHAAFLDRGNHGRNLHLVTDEFGGGLVQFLQSHGEQGQGAGQFPV